MKMWMSENSSHCLVFSLLVFSILVAQLPTLVAVGAESKPVLVMDYSFYKGDLDSNSEPVTRVNGYLNNETWAKCYVKMQHLTDMPEVVGIGHFYGPDNRLAEFRIGKFDARKSGDISIWTFSTDALSKVQNNTGIWRVEMYLGPYFLFSERFTVGDYLADIRLSGLPSRFAVRIMINGAEAGTIRGGERKPSAFATGGHMISVDAFVDVAVGTRYIAKRNAWNVSSADSHVFEYSIQHYLTVGSPHGGTTGSGWYDEGYTASFSAEPALELGRGVRYLFDEWIGDYSGTSTMGMTLMDRPKNVTAGYKTQYYLRVISPHGSPEGRGWYDKGAVARVSVPSIIVLANLTKVVFVRWSGDDTSSTNVIAIVMNKPSVLTANWRVESTHSVLVEKFLYLVVAMSAIVGSMFILFLLRRGRGIR